MQKSNRNQILLFIENKNIKKNNIKEVLEQTEVIPTSKSWYIFIDQIALWFGALSLAFAIMFFMAYNWNEFQKIGRFALVEGLLVLSVGFYLYLDIEKLSSKVSLMVSTILVGVLLALVGQTYQTGADTWQLFFYWAILILPWVFIGRFSALWMVWIFLINLSLSLYIGIFNSEISIWWGLFIFNTLALVLWEFFSHKFEWLKNSWAIRLLGFISGNAVTWLAVAFIWGNSNPLAIVSWIGWLGVIYLLYRQNRIELFMVSMGCLSFSTVVVSFLIHIISWRYLGVGTFLFVGISIVGLGIMSRSWLKMLQKEKYNV